MGLLGVKKILWYQEVPFPLVIVHVGINEVGKCSHVVLEENVMLLGRRFKTRTSKVAFSEVLPVLHTAPATQAHITSLGM